MRQVLTLICARCLRSELVSIDPDSDDEWYILAQVSRRLRNDGHKVTVPLLPQLMEPEEVN